MTMFMAVLTVEFSLDGNDNLKAKRRVANSLKQKTAFPGCGWRWSPFPTANLICAAAWTNARS